VRIAGGFLRPARTARNAEQLTPRHHQVQPRAAGRTGTRQLICPYPSTPRYERQAGCGDWTASFVITAPTAAVNPPTGSSCVATRANTSSTCCPPAPALRDHPPRGARRHRLDAHPFAYSKSSQQEAEDQEVSGQRRSHSSSKGYRKRTIVDSPNPPRIRGIGWDAGSRACTERSLISRERYTGNIGGNRESSGPGWRPSTAPNRCCRSLVTGRSHGKPAAAPADDCAARGADNDRARQEPESGFELAPRPRTGAGRVWGLSHGGFPVAPSPATTKRPPADDLANPDTPAEVWGFRVAGSGWPWSRRGRTRRVFDGTGAVGLGGYACGLMRVRRSLVSVGVCCLGALGAETPCRSSTC
jgi:hypothetical protein